MDAVINFDLSGNRNLPTRISNRYLPVVCALFCACRAKRPLQGVHPL